MGPKQKKSKKQIEEEKALAEQQRLIEEELERKRQEEEAEKRRIEEEKRKIEEEKRRQEELVRLNEQAPFVQQRDASMIEKRKLAIKARRKDLDDKFILCDPLPDPKDEKDLTTFFTLWSEAKDVSLDEALDNSQVAENVVKSIQKILGEARAQYDYEKVKWCEDYLEKIRAMIILKYDNISANIFTYIENYTTLTDEEFRALQNDQRRKKVDSKIKPEFTLMSKSHDIQFGIWANVTGKSQPFRKIDFDLMHCGIPRLFSSQSMIMRCIWTSFDYISGPENLKKFDDIVVGGVVHPRMYYYPDAPKSMLKWTMRRTQSNEDTLRQIHYPEPQSTVQTDPVPMIFKLPEYVFTDEKDQIKVGVWDDEQQCWSSDYIEELTWDKAKRELEF